MSKHTTDVTYAPAKPRRKRRIFLWIFLAIQALFIVWIIAGSATGNAPDTAQIASACYHHAWWPLYSSQADCVRSYGRLMNDASNAGKGLGITLIVVFWCVVDFLVGGGYGVYRLASRRPS